MTTEHFRDGQNALIGKRFLSILVHSRHVFDRFGEIRMDPRKITICA